MYDPLMQDILRKLNNVGGDSVSTIGTQVTESSANDMLDILKRFHLAESGVDSKLTPVDVKHGLNKQQKSVGQTPANFKPKTVKVLGSKTDPKNPFDGKLVGGNESRENNRPVLDEAEVSEDLLSDIKRSLHDYLKQIDDIERTDPDLKKKDKRDNDLKSKSKQDREMFVKRMKEDPTQENPVVQPKPAALINPTVADTGAVQTPTVNTDNSQNPQTVGESLNEPYDLDLHYNQDSFVEFWATSADDQPISITFAKNDDDAWEIEFTTEGQFHTTGKGDAFRIFATVAAAIKQFLKMPQGRQAKSIYFAASGGDPSRIKLYDRMSKLLNKAGFNRVPTKFSWLFNYERPDAQPAMEALKTMECRGKRFEIFGDEKSGFGISHNGKFAPSRFKTFLEADTALELFGQSVAHTGDYREEQ